jgi:hypothetical protein
MDKQQVLALLQYVQNRPGGNSPLIRALCRFWLDHQSGASEQMAEEKQYRDQLTGIRIACLQLTKVIRDGRVGGTFGCEELDRLAKEVEQLCQQKTSRS